MDRNKRLLEFRLRLLSAFGIGALPGLLLSPDVEAEKSAVCVPLDEGEATCPSLDEATPRIAKGQSSSTCKATGIVEAEAGTCCYTVVDCTPPREECRSCYGRPYIADAGVVSAPVVANDAWGPRAALTSELVPNLAGLSPEQRAALAEYWSDNARAEHSSIAGFHRFALDLLAHGAPPELLDRCVRAAADELAHARICYALASHYAGEALGPGPMPLGSSAPIASTLVELAVSTAREGCLSETSAAWLAYEMASATTDPAVRAALEQIAREEAEHAELAWMTLRWAIDVGGAEVEAAVAEVFASATPTRLSRSGIGVPEHGMLAGHEAQAVVERGFHELLVPVMRAAMAA